jgi:hypothetical protein
MNMGIRSNNDVFDQLAAGREYTRHIVGLAAMMGHSSQQSSGLGAPEPRQAENGARTKNAALTRSSRDLTLEFAGPLMESSLAFQRKALQPASKHRAEGKQYSPALGDAAEHISVATTYRVTLNLLEREQITLARKTLDALSIDQLSDPIIIRLRKMLAVPVTKTSQKRDVDRALDYQWIRDHAQDYRGQWVALDDGQLLGAAASLRELLDRVNPLQSRHRPLVHQIP